MRPDLVLLTLVFTLCCACVTPGPDDTEEWADPEATFEAGKSDVVCGRAGPTHPAGYDRLWSNFFLGEARHSIEEPVVQPGEAFSMRARFRYGLVSKDLEHESVEAYVRLEECGEWVLLAETVTDDKGMIDIEVDPGMFPGPGAYDVELVVLGDLSRAVGRIEIIEAGQPMVVFDIDGTLTLSNGELRGALLHGDDPDLYEASPEVAWRYAEEGYFVVYLSGRPHLLQDMSRRWLDAHGYPQGPVITSDHLFEVTGPLVEVHKLEKLDDLMDRAGATLDYAYGNATTDICSYARAGLDPAYTYIVGEHAGKACDGYEATVALDGYVEHLDALDALPPASAM